MADMADSSSIEAIYVGYLELLELSSGAGFRAGLLVVDGRGYPVEFYCTTPVKPTGTQRLLYGRALRPYIVCELLARPLLQHLKNQPEVMLVSDPTFLALRPSVGVPMACITGEESGLPPWVTTDVWKSKRNKVTLAAHRTFDADLSTAADALAQLQDWTNPVEPFQRVSAALAHMSGSSSSKK